MRFETYQGQPSRHHAVFDVETFQLQSKLAINAQRMIERQIGQGQIECHTQ